MKAPMSLGPLSHQQRQRLESDLRARDGFELGRGQILLASARGERPSQIAAPVGWTAQPVRNTLPADCADSAGCLRARSTRPVHAAPLLDTLQCQPRRTMRHQSPGAFGKHTSRWTLALLADVCLAQGLTPSIVSVESIHRARRQMGLNWKRAKHWITRPDPRSTAKKSSATG